MADEAAAGATAYNERAAGLQMEMDNLRKNRALDALERIYGPTAGDPEDAQKNQNYLTSMQQDPLRTQGLALGNTAQDLGNQGAAISNRTAGANGDTAAALRAAQFLKLHANPDGSIGPDAINQVLTPENAQLFGMDPAHLDPTKQIFGSVHGAGAVDHIIQALQAGGAGQLQGSAQYGTDPATGAPVEILHTKSGQTIVRPLQGGATPTILTNAGTSAFRATTGRQNAGTAAFNAGVRANNSEFGSPSGALSPDAAVPTQPVAPPAPTLQTGGISPAAIDMLIKKHGGVDGAIAATADMPNGDNIAKAIADRFEQTQGRSAAATPQPAAIPPDSLFAKLPPKGRNEAIGGAQNIVNQASNLQTINTLLDSVDSQIGAYTTGGGSLLDKIPGTGATDLKANLTSLKAAGLTAWINSLKNSKGQTGIGRVLQSEANAAMAMFGNMEQDQSAHQLQFHSQLFRRAVNNLYQHAQQAFHAQYGVAPEAALGVPPVSTTPASSRPTAPAGWSIKVVK